MCGGYITDYTQTTCILFSDGNWIESHHLLYPRYAHTSWVRPDGAVILIGGDFSRTTTEVLNSDGGSSRSFDLLHESSYDETFPLSIDHIRTLVTPA